VDETVEDAEKKKGKKKKKKKVTEGVPRDLPPTFDGYEDLSGIPGPKEAPPGGDPFFLICH